MAGEEIALGGGAVAGRGQHSVCRGKTRKRQVPLTTFDPCRRSPTGCARRGGKGGSREGGGRGKKKGNQENQDVIRNARRPVFLVNDRGRGSERTKESRGENRGKYGGRSRRNP